ncbi:SDR family NAD(P)-dependent oxidoreductase [Actinomadura keratinilytica]
MARAGRVDALVAGAGIGWAGPFVTMPPEEIDRVLTVNLTSTLRLVRLLLPPMVARGTGRLVLIGSMADWVGVGDEAVYSASKGALLTFADSLRRELAGTRVRVSVVSPGAVDTPFFARRGTPTIAAPRPVSAERVARGCGRRSYGAGRTFWCRGGWRFRRGCTGRRLGCSGPWPTVPTRTAVTEAGARR